MAHAGFEVKTATTVADALELAEHEEFDLLVSDIGLPDGTGYELMRKIQPRCERGIALSGLGMEEDIRKSHEAGFTEHPVKPISMASLRSIIHKVASAPG